MAESSKTYTVTKWVRSLGPNNVVIQGEVLKNKDLTHREALDVQRELTRQEGAQNYTYIYTIEETS